MKDNIRWIVLFLNCVLLIGNYYAYDLPSALSPLLRDHLGSLDDFDYILGLFYAIYSFPNIILPFISGHMIEIVGIKTVLISLSLFVCLGQFLFFIGTWQKSVALMIAGRLVFGLGGESVAVAQSCITTYWFQHKELAFALGLNLAIPRVGTVMNAVLSPTLATKFSVNFAVFFGFLMCVSSLISAFILAYGVGPSPDKETIETDRPNTSMREILKSTLGNTKSLPTQFWILCIVVMLVYGTIIPFNNIIMDFMLYKWFPGNNTRAGQMMGIPDTLCAFLVSPCGYLVDRIGRRASFVIFTSLLIAAVHATLALAPNTLPIILSPILPLVLLGIAYSIYGVAYWSSIACLFTVEDDLDETEVVTIDQSVVSFTQSSVESPLHSRTSFKSVKNLSTTTLPILAASRVISTSKPLPVSSDRSVLEDPSVPLFKAFPSPILRRPQRREAMNSPNWTRRALSQQVSNDSSEQQPLLYNPESGPDLTERHNDTASRLAIAYGISSSAMNLSLTFIPMLVAIIRGSDDGQPRFFLVQMFFVGEALLAAVFGCIVLYVDYKYHDGLRLEGSHYVCL